MKLNDILNLDRVRALQADPNAYVARPHPQPKEQKVQAQNVQKVIFPEPYENARPYYNRQEFNPPPPPEPPPSHNPQHQNSMFDFKSLLPMLMSGKLDMLKPLISMFGGDGAGSGGLGDITKIFELFKPKSKAKKEEKKEEDISSKFDDMIIIED